MVIVEAVPFAEVLDLASLTLALCNNALDGLVELQLLLLALTPKEDGFRLLWGDVVPQEGFLLGLVRLDVVVYTLEPLEPLEELVDLVGVM